MKPFSFWYTRPDALDWRARLLAPLGALYGALTAYRVRQPERLFRHVLSFVSET